jgi:hypothetical protein
MSRLSLIERAYQLAKSGGCRTVTDVKKRLSAEGYPANDLIGKALIDDLLRQCRLANGLSAERPGPPTPRTPEECAARSRKAAETRRANAPPRLVKAS